MNTIFNKLLFCCLGIILLTNCTEWFSQTKYIQHSHIVDYKIVNNTNKVYFCEISQSVVNSSDEVLNSLIAGYDSININFLNTKEMNYYHLVVHYMDSAKIYIYNLSDTSVFNFLHTEKFGIIQNDYIIFNQDYQNISRPEHSFLSAYLLKITQELLSHFQKDHSMLEKFSEYYGN
ncbi:MAG: hypothetical protein LBT04_09210 [Prevotellaceae bacterium]|jgi:hypothetical protein|nr:hypothetical protein [Prevotellaceae bacterium]